MKKFVLYPAIDLAGGRAVRLRQGERQAERVVSPDPVDLALRFAAEGASFLHIVDLDAAFGSGNNHKVIEGIITAVSCPVQVGGGIRDDERAVELRRIGAARVVIGTAAVSAPAWFVNRVKDEPDTVVVAADCKARQIVVRGWVEGAGETLSAFATRMKRFGVEHLLVTAVERDGTGEGVDLAVLDEAVAAFGPGVIASGGVGSLAHVTALADLARRGLSGVIVGSLLVDRKATVGELLTLVEGY